MRPHWMALLGLLAAQGAMAADPPLPLKAGLGEDATVTTCSICHTSDYIIMNSVFLTPDAWKAEVTKMRTAFGAPMDDETAAEITAYLAANYAAAVKR